MFSCLPGIQGFCECATTMSDASLSRCKQYKCRVLNQRTLCECPNFRRSMALHTSSRLELTRRLLLQMYVLRSQTPPLHPHLTATSSIRTHVHHTPGIRRSFIRVDHLGCCGHDRRHGRFQNTQLATYRQTHHPRRCLVLFVSCHFQDQSNHFSQGYHSIITGLQIASIVIYWVSDGAIRIAYGTD